MTSNNTATPAARSAVVDVLRDRAVSEAISAARALATAERRVAEAFRGAEHLARAAEDAAAVAAVAEDLTYEYVLVDPQLLAAEELARWAAEEAERLAVASAEAHAAHTEACERRAAARATLTGWRELIARLGGEYHSETEEIEGRWIPLEE